MGFSMRRTGNIGVEILDPNGSVIALATNDVVGALLCHLLNEHAAEFPAAVKLHERIEEI